MRQPQRLFIRHTELAAMTGMTPGEIKRAVRRGVIPGRIVSKQVVLHRLDEILEWLGVDNLPQGCGIMTYTRARRLWPHVDKKEEEQTCDEKKQGEREDPSGNTNLESGTSSSVFLIIPEEE